VRDNELVIFDQMGMVISALAGREEKWSFLRRGPQFDTRFPQSKTGQNSHFN
jgi:hypothetical protein